MINEAKNSNLDLKSFLIGEAVQNEYEQQLKRYEQAIEEIENIIGKYKLSETIIKLNRINPIDVQEILNIVIKVRKNESEEENEKI